MEISWRFRSTTINFSVVRKYLQSPSHHWLTLYEENTYLSQTQVRVLLPKHINIRLLNLITSCLHKDAWLGEPSLLFFRDLVEVLALKLTKRSGKSSTVLRTGVNQSLYPLCPLPKWHIQMWRSKRNKFGRCWIQNARWHYSSPSIRNSRKACQWETSRIPIKLGPYRSRPHHTWSCVWAPVSS